MLHCVLLSNSDAIIADESSTDELQLAYKEACSRGSKKNYRIHLAVMGHSEAGKTSFIDRLLGKEFKEQRKSTEGIHTHFAQSFFSKKDLVSSMWTETIFEASVLEKDLHEIVLANIKSRGSKSTENPIQKVVRWLQNNTMNGQPHSANDNPCLESRQEVSKFSEECAQTFSITTGSKETVFDKEPHTKVEITIGNKGAKRQEEAFSDDEDIAQPNFSKMRSDEYTQSLDSKLTNTELPNNERRKDKWSPNQMISSEASLNTTNYQAHSAVESTKSNNNDNDSEEPLYLNQEITSKMSYATLNRLKHRKETYTTPSDERIPYSINIWDHGGQNEFIITNQLFLNVEAFILMVMDISRDLNIPLKQSADAEGKFGIPKTPVQILCYWLNALHVLAKKKGTEPNIALVLTHKDMIKADDTKKYIDSYIEELLECINGKPYASYINISNIYAVDNRQGTEVDFTHVRNKIFAQMTKQKSWGIERPIRWLQLEADILEKAKDIGKPYLYTQIVKDLASALALSKSELKSFLRFHHILGDFICYPDKKLNDIVVTNPQWLLNMFKSLITPHEFLYQRELQPNILMELKSAVVSEECLELVWEGNDIQFLKDVMVNFDLMMPLGSEQKNQKYLIPCMLPSLEVQIDRTDPFTDMTLIYSSTLEPENGNAMPVGAFHKLLSQCSKTPRWNIWSSDYLSYTQALIEIDSGVHIELKLRRSNSIDISIWCSKEQLNEGYLSINEARTLIVRTHRNIGQVMKIARKKTLRCCVHTGVQGKSTPV